MSRTREEFDAWIEKQMDLEELQKEYGDKYGEMLDSDDHDRPQREDELREINARIALVR